MNFLPIGRRYFKYIWKEKKLFCHRSEIFKLNEKVIKSVLDFKRYIPNLCYLVDLKDFLDDGKPQLKDLKLGGEFTLQDIRVRYWIKIIIRQNLDVVVKVIGMSDAIQIVKCLTLDLAKRYSTIYHYRALFQYEVKDEGYIMGRFMESKKDILDVIILTIRFTYRQGFQVYQCWNSTLTTDSGWVYVIRVGQMMMAELLQRHLKCFYNVNLFSLPLLMQEVLQLFKDDDEMESSKLQGKPSKYRFSIQKIMREAYKKWGKKPGEWYSPNQIVYVIYKIQSDNNIIYSCGLSFLPFYESQIDQRLFCNRCV
ncbi:unnamed protein product [Paramecium octaurelia]|uniref:Cysteine protease n=1 Tax=Paramecium octaurelia TaxID=43137 RepID=A0A8S1UDV3_PAROT|nr:unnamed protein product [Paramecium octaurelia]